MKFLVRAVAILLVLLCTRRSGVGQDRREEPLYVATAGDIAAVVQGVLGSAEGESRDAVVFVLDTPSFFPPPNDRLFQRDHCYSGDAKLWLSAMRQLPMSTRHVFYVTGTQPPHPIRVGDANWAEDFELEQSRSRWWQIAVNGATVRSASQWIGNVLDAVPGKAIQIVLVTGGVEPEEPCGTRRDASTTGLSSLLPRGAYWDDTSIIEKLRRRRVRLDVVAPQARFGECYPADEIPSAPWAARPTGFRDAVMDPRADEAGLEALRAKLIAMGISSEDADRTIKRLSVQVSAAGTANGIPNRVVRPRFTSNTPFWLLTGRAVVESVTDCPSGFGYWDLARAARETGGRYYFYPYPGGTWLDVCPFDVRRRDELAPELSPRRDWLRQRERNRALRCMLEVEEGFTAAFPWSIDLNSVREVGTRWGPFRLSGDTVRFETSRDTRLRAFETWLVALTDVGVSKMRTQLADVGVKVDAAVRKLRGAEVDLAADGGGKSRRDVANLRLFAFWLETCAFHAEALCATLDDLDQRKKDIRIQGDPVFAVVPVVRLSDCFAAYDGRMISADEELLLRPKPIDWVDQRRGYMATMLQIRQEDARYRARRSMESVEKSLTPALRSRLKQVVAAGQLVLEDYARTPWGWMVYYSELMQVVLDDRIATPFSLERCGNTLAGPVPPVTVGGGPSTPR
jgi:hypothetical protein